MHSVIAFKRLTGFAWGRDNPAPEVWVNPTQIAYVQPRIVFRGRAECTDGSRIYFQQEAGVLDVRESIGYVVALLQSGSAGMCRDCYQLLAEAWRTLCDDCRRARHAGVDADPQEASLA
jgi:hypothetical protein